MNQKMVSDAGVPWRMRTVVAVVFSSLALWALCAVALQVAYRIQGAPHRQLATPPGYLSSLAPLFLCAIVLVQVWLLVIRRYDLRWSALGLRWPRPGSLLLLLSLGGLLLIGTVVLLFASEIILRFTGQSAAIEVGGMPPTSDPLYPLVALGTIACIPLVEEVVWRGLFYQAARATVRASVATVMSAALYAVSHLQITLLPEAFLLGAVAAMAVEGTGSLYPSILLNVAFNVVLIVLIAHRA